MADDEDLLDVEATERVALAATLLAIDDNHQAFHTHQKERFRGCLQATSRDSRAEMERATSSGKVAVPRAFEEDSTSEADFLGSSSTFNIKSTIQHRSSVLSRCSPAFTLSGVASEAHISTDILCTITPEDAPPKCSRFPRRSLPRRLPEAACSMGSTHAAFVTPLSRPVTPLCQAWSPALVPGAKANAFLNVSIDDPLFVAAMRVPGKAG